MVARQQAKHAACRLAAANVVVAGDNFGRLHFVDPRMSVPVASLTVHKKKGSKVRLQLPPAPCLVSG